MHVSSRERPASRPSRVPLGAAALCALGGLHALSPPAWHPAVVLAVLGCGIGAVLQGIRANGPAAGSGWQRFGLGVALYASSDVVYVLSAVTLGRESAVGTVAWLAGLAAGIPLIIG